MFFLFRCMFWLGLVFSHIATLEGAQVAAGQFRASAQNTAQAAVQGAARSASDRAAGLGRLAVEAAARRCGEDPAACVAAAAKTSQWAQSQLATTQWTLKPSAAKPAAPSRDTLQDSDRAPSWRLRPGRPENDRQG